MKASVGYADLARLFRMLPSEDHLEAAALLGFRRTAPAAVAPALPARDDVSPAPAVPERAPIDRAGFFRVTSVVERGPTPVTRPPPHSQELTQDDLRSEPERALPPSPPLARWSTLWSRLGAALHASRPGREPDVAALLRIWARGEYLRRIPRRARRTWTTSAALWIDRSQRLTPFWDDQEIVARQLVRLCGAAAIERRILDAYRQASLAAWCGDLIGRETSDPAAPVLVLGDLGFYGSASDRARWLRTAQRLRRNGVRVSALVPCPISRWDRTVARAWNATPWERTRSGGDRGTPVTRAEALLRLVAPTALAQPGLLRALRQLLPAAEADASTEVDVWQHPDVQAADVSGLVLKSEASTRWRERFVADVPSEIQADVSARIRDWHGRWRAELIHAETLAWIALGLRGPPGPPDEAKAFLEKVFATLCREVGGDEHVAAVKHYARHLLGALPDRSYVEIPELKPVWSVAFDGIAGARLPSTIDPRELFVRTPQPPRSWAMHQRGDALVMLSAESWSPLAENQPGSLVATIMAARPEIWAQRRFDPGATRTWLFPRAEVALRPGEELTLRTDCDEVTIEIWERAAWAVTAGRDRHGLWAAFEVDGVQQRLRWIPPGRFLMGAPQVAAPQPRSDGPPHWVTLTRGYWLGETPVTQALWRAVMKSNPSQFVSDDRPVVQVSWDDCEKFIAQLNRALEGFEARLPTEAEWERACRGGSGAGFDLDQGEDSPDWPERQHARTPAGTHPVGRRRPNPYGLHDMLGNVSEWWSDPTSTFRIHRGGSWRSGAGQLRADQRDVSASGDIAASLGLRLAGDQVPAHSGPGPARHRRS